jgi:hypothetical protein
VSRRFVTERRREVEKGCAWRPRPARSTSARMTEAGSAGEGGKNSRRKPEPDTEARHPSTEHSG